MRLTIVVHGQTNLICFTFSKLPQFDTKLKPAKL